MRPDLLIGVGTGHGDDAAGLLVARRLQRQRARFEILVHRGDLLDLLEVWEGRKVALVDAAVSGAPAGTVHRLNAASPLLSGLRLVSGHSFGPSQAIELARALGRFPDRLVVYAIEGRRFEPRTLPCSEVRRAVRAVAALLLG